MLKKRIIPKLLIQNKAFGRMVRPVLVTTRNFEQVFEVGDPLSQAKIYEAQLADELIVLNIERLPIARDGALLDVIEKLASQTFMPIAVGGGVTSIDDFATLLESGADKVTINTSAVETPELIGHAAHRFGAQCVVASIDVRRAGDGYAVFTRRATVDTRMDPVTWARRVVEEGAGEIVLTDADRDGTGNGLNTSLGAAVADAVPVPVILAGGCGVAQHFVEGFQAGKAEGVAAGTFFCFRDQNPMQTRAHVRSAGVPIRLET
jgi:imidazole glycerol-phosphate synthase subunit HisF